MAATDPTHPKRRWTSADLIYDPVTHTSKDPDGQDVPHVTHILSAVGVSTDFDELAAKSPRLAQAILTARDRGTAFHADSHSWDDDDLDLTQVDERVRPYLDAWIECREAKGLKPIKKARERRIYHPVFNYTGILDGIFFWEPQGLNVLVDEKTGDPDDSGCAWQTAAYEKAWLIEHPDIHIDRRWGVQLRPNHRVPFRIIDYTAQANSWMHFPQFQAMLTTYLLQAAQRSGRQWR